METTYTIGRLAEAAEVPISTVRYYEQRGLLEPDQRTRASYRIYTAEGLKRLRFIKAAQNSGFTLEDIRLLLDLREGAADPCGDVREVVAKRLGTVGTQLRELRRVERVLRETLAWCDKPRAKGCCPAIEGLEVAASKAPKTVRKTTPTKRKGPR